MSSTSLENTRYRNAEEAWQAASFDNRVEAVNGWESDGENRLSRAVFFDVGAEETEKAFFAVEFLPGTAVLAHEPECNEPAWRGPEAQRADLFGFSVNLDERGLFYADVRDREGQSLFVIHSPDEEGHSTLEDLGMRNKEDIAGLKDHLVSLGVIGRDAELLPLVEFEKRIDAEEVSPALEF